MARSPLPSPMPPPSTGRCQPLDIEPDIHSVLTPPEFRQMRSVQEYDIIKKVGEGTYGAVFLAKEKTTGERVALKKIKLDHNVEKEGFPITSLREVRHLFKVAHPNVVKLKEMVYGGRSLLNECDLYMVLEYLEHDLLGVQQTLKNRGGGSGGGGTCFSIADVKCYIHQLMKGLHACHSAEVLHRDLKSANLLVSKEGLLKIADFGLSRQSSTKGEKLTPKVCTLWYRPPELLMAGHRLEYGAEVDIWSAGCIFAELLSGRPLFDKNVEVEALHAICHICGSPNPEDWPGVTALPGWVACVKDYRENRLAKTLLTNINRGRPKQSDEEKAAIAEAIVIICDMLQLNPARRPTAIKVFSNDFFYHSKPVATDPAKLAGVTLGDSHALDWEGQSKRNKGEKQDRGKGGKMVRNMNAGGGADAAADGGQHARHGGPMVAGGPAGPREHTRYDPYTSRGSDNRRGGAPVHARAAGRDFAGPRADHDRRPRDDRAGPHPGTRPYDASMGDRARGANPAQFPPSQAHGPNAAQGPPQGQRYVGDRYQDYDYVDSWGGKDVYRDYDY